MTAMDEKELRRLLRAQELTKDERGWRCPGEAEIAAYVEHRASATDEARIESHLADCDACLGQVAFLVRHPASPGSSVAPQVLSRARDLVPDKQVVWRAPVLRWGAVTATAVLVAFVLGRQVRAPGMLPPPPAPTSSLPAPAATLPAPATAAPAPPATAPPATTPQPAPPPQSAVRKSVSKPLQLALLFPSESATLSPGQLEFRWQALPATAYYEVHIVTEDGTVVWQGKVEGTRARPPGGISLETGKKYFVWIRAYLSGGGTVKSAAVSFHVADR